MKRNKLAITAAMLAAVCLFGLAGRILADNLDSSQQCINCHTDFDRMDEYGAAAAGGGAAIAG